MLNNDIQRRLALGLLFLCAHVTGEMPNVLLLSVDTLRADFLGCYGCPWDISPNIDRLAEQSLVFDNACCETPLTAPSFSAMLTSRYPRMTGAMRNGMGISEDTEVITTSFQSAGYHTFAVQ
ncbi:MAG TPA: sulfatase-like hydrolase/transferase, partial [Candidatus Hydrogenedentes bacterium]|nr:sulfatase-like hydrolase/transferase [Candidatus Hydrogenedentota bacterium]